MDVSTEMRRSRSAFLSLLTDFSSSLFSGPSITPLTGNNAGFVRYQVDGKTFSVIDSQTYIANVSESLTWSTPQWKCGSSWSWGVILPVMADSVLSIPDEYDARTTYGSTLNWPADAPLNATFWNGKSRRNLSLPMYHLLKPTSPLRRCHQRHVESNDTFPFAQHLRSLRDQEQCHHQELYLRCLSSPKSETILGHG